MKNAVSFLGHLTELFPVKDGPGAHALSLDQIDGVDVLRVTLAGHITDGGQWPSFTFEPSDLEREPKELAVEIEALCRARGVVVAPPLDTRAPMNRFR